jgi:hypothetical protein
MISDELHTGQGAADISMKNGSSSRLLKKCLLFSRALIP